MSVDLFVLSPCTLWTLQVTLHYVGIEDVYTLGISFQTICRQGDDVITIMAAFKGRT